MAEKASKAMSLLDLAEQRASLRKKLEEGKQKQQLDSVPYLPKDCISNILVRLPLESLQRSRFVCKPWYTIINSPTFVQNNLHRSEKLLIFLTAINRVSRRYNNQLTFFSENPNTFSVESKIFHLKSIHALHRPVIDSSVKYAIRYMKFADGKSIISELNATCLGKIRATCEGLIVLDNKLKKGELVIMNPVTRELDLLPLGTIYPPHDESFALVNCTTTKGYKLIHLFRDESQFIGCEVLRIGERSWKVVDGPEFGLLKWFGYEPVFAIGALHWVSELDHSEYLVTMTIDDDRFRKIELPKVGRFNDRIMEVSGCLCFVGHEETNETGIWVLESLEGEWKKIYTIGVGCIRDLIPLYFPKFRWEIYFMDKDGSVFVYDFEKEQMGKVVVKKGSFPFLGGAYMIHVNSLVSLSIKENSRDTIEY